MQSNDLIWILTVLLIVELGCATNRQSEYISSSKMIRMSCPPRTYNPTFVIEINDKSYQVNPNSADSVLLNTIKSDWIKSVSLIKSEEVLGKYGIINNDGVVILGLKKSKYSRLDERLKAVLTNNIEKQDK